MRDVSGWSGNYYTDRLYVGVEVRNRYPSFNWRSGSTYYVNSSLGETWGDSPGTVQFLRERNLPRYYIHGGFVVMNDSITLSGGNILRASSERAGNQGIDIFWKEISSSSDLTSFSTWTPSADPPRTWSGIGLTQHTTANMARLFYFLSSDNKMGYRDYTGGTGWDGTTYDYTNSPTFDYDGVAVAPVDDDQGFVITYDQSTHEVKVYHFDSGSWDSTSMPMRYPQHYLNCHWFDAVPLGSDYLVTFNVNGVQYAMKYTSNGFTDPWPVMAFDPEFGSIQIRIAKMTKVGSRVMATAWSRYAGSSNDYEISYYNLIWTDDGFNWAMPEEGYIGLLASRGKLHTIGSDAYILGNSVSYLGSAVTWLGGSSGVQSALADNLIEHNMVSEINSAADLKLPIMVSTGFDKSLLTYGNEVVYQVGIQGESAVNLAVLSLDTPGNVISDRDEVMEIVCRGPLKRLIGYTMPIDQTIEGAIYNHADFDEGGIYARWGTWNTESGAGYCDSHEEDNALATVGLQYTGEFQANARIRVTEYTASTTCGIVFWYEGPSDYWRLDITGVSGGRLVLRQVSASVNTTMFNEPLTGGFVAGTWYDVCIRYLKGTVYVHIKPDGGSWQSETHSTWSSAEPEPVNWYAGLFVALPKTTTTDEIEARSTQEILVESTSQFPSTGTIKVGSEKIEYLAKQDDRFGGSVGDLVRGVRSERASHPEGTPVYIADNRYEVDSFSVFQTDLPQSVSDAANRIITRTGTDYSSIRVVDVTSPGASTFPEAHGQSWVVDGTYGSSTLKMTFWTDTNDPPTTGISIDVTSTTATLASVTGGTISQQPVSALPASGSFRIMAIKDAMMLWVNGAFACAFRVPGDIPFRVGSIACSANVSSLQVEELFEPVEAVVWSIQENGRSVLARLLEGRDAYLRERYDGSVEVTLLEERADIGSLDGTYFVSYESQAADEEWASAMVAWGAESWVMLVEPEADRLRWVQWHTPYTNDPVTLRYRAMNKLRKLWALRNLKAFRGSIDPRVEVGDELTISSIRGIASGDYMVRSIEFIGNQSLLDMRVVAHAVPGTIATSTWPMKPGVDIPTRGE